MPVTGYFSTRLSPEQPAHLGTMHDAKVHSWPQGGRMSPARTLNPSFHCGTNRHCSSPNFTIGRGTDWCLMSKMTNWNIPVNINPKPKLVTKILKMPFFCLHAQLLFKTVPEAPHQSAQKGTLRWPGTYSNTNDSFCLHEFQASNV